MKRKELIIVLFATFFCGYAQSRAWPTPAAGVVCPETTCSCIWGQVNVLDADQCTVCQCVPKPCGTLDCSNNRICPYGRVLDPDGCPMCKCKRATCPENLMCSSGFPTCLDGYSKNKHGCKTCKCRTHNCGYFDANDCEHNCTDGFSTNEYGCQTCACKNTTCPEVTSCSEDCQADEIDEKTGCTKCTCDTLKFCPEVRCDYCTYGAVYKDGCKTCSCKGKSLGNFEYTKSDVSEEEAKDTQSRGETKDTQSRDETKDTQSRDENQDVSSSDKAEAP